MPKEEVKETLGRSPDFSDTLMMRMMLEYKNTGGKAFTYFAQSAQPISTNPLNQSNSAPRYAPTYIPKT